MNATGAEPTLRNFKTAARSSDDVVERYPNIRETHLTVTERRIIGAKYRHHALDLYTGSIDGHQNHGMTPVPRGGVIGYAHKDEQAAVGVAGSGTPPFPAVQNHMLALNESSSLHVGRI